MCRAGARAYGPGDVVVGASVVGASVLGGVVVVGVRSGEVVSGEDALVLVGDVVAVVVDGGLSGVPDTR
jgi:hypothetical protein